MADNETIADIVAEKRRDAQHIRNNLSTVPVRRLDQLAEIKSLADEADRIEAAHKREMREAVTDCNQFSDAAKTREALKLCVDEMCDRCRELAVARGNPLPCLSGCEPVRKAKAALAATATAEKSSAVGDVAKLREAVKKLLDVLYDMGVDENTLAIAIESPNCQMKSEYTLSVLKEARAALAAPPRNCDHFATVDEARKAHEAICEKYGKCHHGCPLNNEEHYSAFDCFEAWLFAPATEKEGGNDGNE